MPRPIGRGQFPGEKFPEEKPVAPEDLAHPVFGEFSFIDGVSFHAVAGDRIPVVGQGPRGAPTVVCRLGGASSFPLRLEWGEVREDPLAKRREGVICYATLPGKRLRSFSAAPVREEIEIVGKGKGDPTVSAAEPQQISRLYQAV